MDVRAIEGRRFVGGNTPAAAIEIFTHVIQTRRGPLAAFAHAAKMRDSRVRSDFATVSVCHTPERLVKFLNDPQSTVHLSSRTVRLAQCQEWQKALDALTLKN